MAQMKRANEREAAQPAERSDPPHLYFPACGALCDALWWARPYPADTPAAATSDRSEG